MKIRHIHTRTVFDSRANATVEACITNDEGRVFTGIVPAGKSTGSNEAFIMPPAQAEEVVRERVASALEGREIESIREMDAILREKDGTVRKEMIGGNIMLGLSYAAARALAFDDKKELWQRIEDEFFPERTHGEVGSPYIFSNLVNGGAHAANNLSIQEYMVIVDTAKRGMQTSIEDLIALYRMLGEALRARLNSRRIAIGDESGYSLDFETNLEPIQLLESLITETGRADNYRIGLDVAASGFWSGEGYAIDGRIMSGDELLALYSSYASQSHLLSSIEDPFEEADSDHFVRLHKELPDVLVVGDDLTTTDPHAIKQFAEAGAISGVIIKPNQIGTVTETCEAIKMAHTKDVRTIVSHRSGETEDNGIMHIARAAGVYGVKIGAPLRERVFKFNELIRVYGERQL